MKLEKKITAYPLNDLYKIIWNFIYEYKYSVNKLFKVPIGTPIRVGFFKRGVIKEQALELRQHPIPNEVIEAHEFIVSEKDIYNDSTFKKPCSLLQQKDLLLNKIKSQADVYIIYNHSLFRNLLHNLAGLIFCIVIAIVYQRMSLSPEPGIGLFGMLFKCISIYLGASIFYQSLKAFVNTIISKHELLFWKKVTVGLLDEKEYAYYVIAPLSGLKKSLYVVYPSVLMVYVALFYYSYKFPLLLQSLTFSWL
jgi:hypothetical protein